MEVRFTDNSQVFLNALHDEAIPAALEAIGEIGEDAVKTQITENRSVDTGLLRNSLTFAVGGQPANQRTYRADRGGETGSYNGLAPEGSKVFWGSNVKYAASVEVRPNKSYLKKGLQNVTSEFEQVLRGELENG